MNVISRRALLGGLFATPLALSFSRARAHSNAGVVAPPLAPPSVDLTLDDERTTSLQKLLRGKVTAVQLMFTTCSATCPIQGAVFAAGARELGERIPDAQWLSLSIDPTRDTAKSLHGWMARFGAHPRWRAALPAPREVDRLVEFLKARTSGPDKHTAQVYYFNRKGQLALRSVDFPPAKEIIRILEELSKVS